MSTWYDVVEPHEDIKKGNFDEAIFAAKLGDVALGKAVVDYIVKAHNNRTFLL